MLTDLVFPRVCPLCHQVLSENEKIICSRCMADLPETHFKNMQDNPVARIFWGRIPFLAATSYLFFEKENKAQKLIHEIKYRSNKELGYATGLIYGHLLRAFPIFRQVDMVVPVPLHKRKQKIRGFNQSEWISRGIAESLNKPVDTKTLYRQIYNPSQTKKNRYNRWKNVEGIFALHNPENFSGKHLLLVDDVITTGSTIEACATVILKAPETSISITSLAFAY